MNQKEFARVVSALTARGEPFAVATIVKTDGSTLGKPGFKAIITKGGEVPFGTLGGACPVSVLVTPAKKAMETGTPKNVRIFLESVEDSVGAVLKSEDEDEIHVETNCGGIMDVFVEPCLPQQRLVIIGEGGKDDVEDAIVRLGKILDFEVIVIDHSPMLREEPDQLVKDPTFDVATFPFSAADSVVVLTKGERDVGTLRSLSKFSPRYVGLVASRRRAVENTTKLRELGVDERFVSSIRSPAGADLGGATPSEIALSIMAEVVAVRYGKSVSRKGLTVDARTKSD